MRFQGEKCEKAQVENEANGAKNRLRAGREVRRRNDTENKVKRYPWKWIAHDLKHLCVKRAEYYYI